MNKQTRVTTVVPFSLKDAPAFIETQMPVGRVSAEAYKERKAGAGQTLTSLGSYWKGRKPLVLVRATLLGCLLPATGNHLADLRVFLMLMGMNDIGIARRLKSISPKTIDKDWARYGDLIDADPKPAWKAGLGRAARMSLIAEWAAKLPYDARLALCLRPEEMEEQTLLEGVWPAVNEHLGTSAASLPELVEQLGIMRYGRSPRVADTFCGGGSIPFEAARMGFDVYASDLNPIACMLAWGAFNVIGADERARADLEQQHRQLTSAVDAELTHLAIEHDHHGNRAKAYLYCLEVRCPRTGWMVPLAPSWVISGTWRVIARLKPDHVGKRYDIEIEAGVDPAAVREAEKGTLRDGRVVHPMNPEQDGVALSVIRGDHRVGGENRTRIRRWGKEEFEPRPDDVFQERLYCIQWITKQSLEAGRQETYFAAVNDEDLRREQAVRDIVSANLGDWQFEGLVPDMPIEPGLKTDEPIRTRGWTHWHHLFPARTLLRFALTLKKLSSPIGALEMARNADRLSKLCRFNATPQLTQGPKIEQTFSNQALNTLYNYGIYSFVGLDDYIDKLSRTRIAGRAAVSSSPAASISTESDIYVTDPPYADAVVYHEITEFFIAWLRKHPPAAFKEWTWDAQRSVAIKGSDERFRTDMVGAYRAMATKMPSNGVQVVMFTHQSAAVWADLAAVMWAAGLRVTAAWNIVTETTSALKTGNYVQGTILLVLRKRSGAGNKKRMDIEGEIENAVDHQMRALNDLSHDWTAERLYTDGDLQLAAYAAALRVITNYETIDRVQVGADVYRKLKKGERTVIRDLIDYAASVANNKLVPDGFPTAMWRDLDKTSRFYIRMLDMEARGSTKFADYQDFAKTFSVGDYTGLMADTKANQASLAGSATLKATGIAGEFGAQPLRRVLFAIFKTMQKGEPRDGLNFLKLEYGPDYWSMRAKLIEFARYVAVKTAGTRPDEAVAADLLMQKLEVDRI